MHLVKKLTYPFLLLTLGLLFIGGIYASFFAPKEIDIGASIHKTYTSIQDLKNEAELIVEGTTLADQTTFSFDQVLFTHTPFQINRMYKGNVEKDRINILETGGFDGKHHWTIEGNRIMEPNQSYILFLKKYIGPVTNEESYIVLGAYQGRFVVNGQNVLPGKEVAPSLSQIKDKQTLIQLITTSQ